MSINKQAGRGTEKKQKVLTGKTPQEEVEEYNAIFESLKKKTHKNDLKEILALFEDYENKNYSLYQHLSHLSDEKETLERQIHQIKDEIAKLTQSEQKEADEGAENKAKKIQDLKDEIDGSDKHYKVLETKQQGLTETINALKVREIYEKKKKNPIRSVFQLFSNVLDVMWKITQLNFLMEPYKIFKIGF